MYRINEIFRSIQGEGIRAGTVNVFVRFAECNLACSYCDTDFSAFEELTAAEIVERCVALDRGRHRNVILTGGEPSLQYDAILAAALRRLPDGSQFYVAMETNGMRRLDASVDWLTVSPKTAAHTIHVYETHPVHELKYVLDVGQRLPLTDIPADHFLISPCFRGGLVLAPETVVHCIQLCEENPPWRLSVQLHKFLKIR